MQTESVFASKYAEGTNKALYWDHTYEDVMNLIARLPEVCALIYRCTYFDGKVPAYDTSTDYSGNFCQVGCMRAPCLPSLRFLPDSLATFALTPLTFTSRPLDVHCPFFRCSA